MVTFASWCFNLITSEKAEQTGLFAFMCLCLGVVKQQCTYRCIAEEKIEGILQSKLALFIWMEPGGNVRVGTELVFMLKRQRYDYKWLHLQIIVREVAVKLSIVYTCNLVF